MANEATHAIVGTLSQILADHGLEVRTESSYRKWEGRRSARADIAGLLPSGRPVLWIEVDSTPPGASHNALKLWASPVDLASLPIAVLRVWFDGAAKGADITGPLYQAGFALPPHLVSTPPLVLDGNEEPDALAKYVGQFLMEPVLPESQEVTLAPVLHAYQQLQCYGALGIASAHLSARVDLAWFLVSRGSGSVLTAAQLSCALARLLQQGGKSSDAWVAAERVRRELRDSGPEQALDPVLADELNSIEFKLKQPPYGTVESKNLLDAAANGLTRAANRAKFMWRHGLDSLVKGEPDEAERYLQSYVSLLPDERNARSNYALVRTCAALASEEHRHIAPAMTWATEYSRIERQMWRDHGSAVDGSIHGVVTGLYLQIVVLKRVAARSNAHRYDEFEYISRELDKLRALLAISWNADGLRDIVPFVHSTGGPLAAAARRVQLYEVLSPDRYQRLETLCDRVDELSELI